MSSVIPSTAIAPAYESCVLCCISDFLNAFHIYAFSLVSGYLFYYLRIEKRRYEHYLSFVKGKFFRLIVPYYFVCIIWVVPVAQFFFHYSAVEIVNRYILGTNPNQLWFLLMLFWVYIIVWPISHMFDKKILGGALIVGSLYSVGVIGSRLIPNYFFIWRSCEYVLFFWVGFMMRKLPELFKHIKWYMWLGLFMILFAVWETIDNGYINSILEIVVHITGAIAAFETLNALAEKNRWKKSWFTVLSSKTMPMYLFHQQIIYFCILLLNGKVNPYINAFANLLFALIGSCLISTVLMKWKATRFLIGEKR